MSTYLISDIHGAADPLKRLIDKIELKKEDNVYFLGDYADWGSHSMETLGFIMDMDEDPHVHCLLGNHDQMFLDQIEKGRTETPDPVWYFGNNGKVTWDAYCMLKEVNRKAIYKWLKKLEYSAEFRIGSELYMAAHAYPYFGNRGRLSVYYTKDKAVWHRMHWNGDPFINYHGSKKYRAFICGHTITDHYCREKGDAESREAQNSIFIAPHFIDIDCGAKCFEYKDQMPEQAGRARLAALRVDDMHVFYSK